VLLTLVFAPAAAGILAFGIRSHLARRTILVAVAFLHALLVAVTWFRTPSPSWHGALALDEPGLLFLSIASALFLVTAFYAVGYLARETPGRHADFEDGFLFVNQPEAVFTGCLLLFLATMTLVTVSQHFGLLWVAVEATTLSSAPLIYFHRQHRSLEATWKYLIVCSVGIGLALLGTMFLSVAAARAGGAEVPLSVAGLVARGGALDAAWLKLAFVLLLVGYGTKMGLAPLHTWLPDAHSESPSVVSALMSGTLLNCAFLAVLRAYQVCVSAGLGPFCRELLVVFGLVSMGVAAVFLIGQSDFKRLLAYSSVEHMGILALGTGIGGLAGFGALLHAVNHSLAKAMLFLVAGNVLARYKTKSVADVRGILATSPRTGALWVAGFFAITGAPPFGLFVSEFIILRGAMEQGRPAIAVAYLALLAVAFFAMADTMLRMAQGPSSAPPSRGGTNESRLAWLPPAVLGGAVVVLGVWLPPVLNRLLEAASTVIGGRG
jgi:hydrogenase-4 component F